MSLITKTRIRGLYAFTISYLADNIDHVDHVVDFTCDSPRVTRLVHRFGRRKMPLVRRPQLGGNGCFVLDGCDSAGRLINRPSISLSSQSTDCVIILAFR